MKESTQSGASSAFLIVKLHILFKDILLLLYDSCILSLISKEGVSQLARNWCLLKILWPDCISDGRRTNPSCCCAWWMISKVCFVRAGEK